MKFRILLRLNSITHWRVHENRVGKKITHNQTYTLNLAPFIRMFLGALAKLQKTNINFFMSLLRYVRMEKFCSHCTDFHEI